MLPGITILISPLISLMQDQVKALNEAGIHAGYINSFLTDVQISRVYAKALEGAYKLLYVAPERLESFGFTEFVSKIEISMVTVDEAHCISQRGQDFRPSYLKIVEFVGGLPKRPIVSTFTATATKEVKTDISCTLKLQNPKIVVTGYNRENLYFDVEAIKKKDDYVLEYIKRHSEDSGIIYCATRKNVDALYELLSGGGGSRDKISCRYGERFIEAIALFLDENPDSATSITDNEDVPVEKVRVGKRRKNHKDPFCLNPEDKDRFECGNYYLLSEIKDELNRITTADNVKHIFGTDIFKLLTQMGYVEEKQIDGRIVQIQTELGISKGVITVDKISKIGNKYTVLMYPPGVQREIVEHYIEIGGKVESDDERKRSQYVYQKS